MIKPIGELMQHKLQNPEGFLQVSVKFFGKKLKEPRCIVKILNGAENIEAGAYVLINLKSAVKNGDRVLCEINGQLRIMRVIKKDKTWYYMPLHGGQNQPAIMKDLHAVAGKIERVFNMPK